jgi:hypothetical protein
LTGDPAAAASRIVGGGNSGVYRVDAGGKSYALKCYADIARLEREYRALTSLQALGFGSMVPQPIRRDAESPAAIYGWIEGTRVGDADAHEIDALLSLMRYLHDIRNDPAMSDIGEAVEAGLNVDGIEQHLLARVTRLRTADADALGDFLDEIVALTMLASKRARAALGPDALARSRQTLSQSDVGFHNAIRALDGRIVFIDFEYFGWDDPVKQMVDFLWHPAMVLAQHAADRFRIGAAGIYANDAGYGGRFAHLEPMHGLRWTLTVLNEFIPEIWQRRLFAGTVQAQDETVIKSRQLEKARAFADRVARIMETPTA